MPALKAKLLRMRNSLKNAKHKFFRYVFNGKGACGPDQSTVYDISNIFDKDEHRYAEHFFLSLKRAIVGHR
jgi:hypothetical protein